MPAPRTPSGSAAPGRRPALSAREVQALREALALREAHALREALATGRPLTAADVAAVRAGARPPARRATQGNRRAPARRPRSRPAPRRRSETPRTGFRWSTRLGIVALSTVLLPAVASLALPVVPPSGEAGPLDATELALTAQSTLLGHADEYRRLQQEVAAREAELDAARAAEQAALAHVVTDQQGVGVLAAELYRTAPGARYPVLGVRLDDPAATTDALYRHALMERDRADVTAAAIRAERTGITLASASRRVADAQADVDAMARAADAVLESVRKQADALDAEVAGRLAGLGAVPVTGPQQERNARAMARWQDYLAQLAAAKVQPPPSAALADLADLPAGLSPALDGSGTPIPGIAWTVIGSRPFPVLPAETVTAVSAALSQLGKPFVPDTSGPDAYDCGGFTSAAWLLGGHAVPRAPQDQWATGTPVPIESVQVGDLVHSPGGLDVGIYLGDGDVVGASAGTYSVAIRSLVAGSTATRVTLPAPAVPNAPLPPGGDAGPCGAPLPAPGVSKPDWGGWANGQIPAAALCELGVHRHALRCDAAASYDQLSRAFAAEFGTPLCITDSYRSFGAQVAAFYVKPALAAVPGTSNHGWGLAVDLCGGINVAGSPQWTWMTANAGRFGFVQPDWASPAGEKPEPWHWEYGYIS